MALDATHPRYDDMVDRWVLCEDANEGEERVKSKGQVYLPATAGMIYDGMSSVNAPGYQAYQAYLTRAVFPGAMTEGVAHMLGIMHSRPPKIQLPDKLRYMEERASSRGEGLHQLLRRINEQQLIKGRLGIMLDLPERPVTGTPELMISLYEALNIRNWDENLNAQDRTVLNMVVLDESRWERQPSMEWKWVQRYRVLSLGDVESNEATGVYGQALVTGTDMPTSLKQPRVRGKTLSAIPFEFINSIDCLSNPGEPPMLTLAQLCMTIYRGEADYRQNLFMQGQDTLVISGAPDAGEEGERIGAGAILALPTGAEAKYVGVESQGLAEQRNALAQDYAMAAQRSGQLATAKSKQIESGEALQTRIASTMASLTTIAEAGALGLQRILRTGAEWVGADPSQVLIEPNLQFGDLAFSPRDLVEMGSARQMGIPLSAKSMHEMLRERGMTRMTFEEEQEAMRAEDETLLGALTTSGDLPEDDLPSPSSGGDNSGGSSSAAAASGAG